LGTTIPRVPLTSSTRPDAMPLPRSLAAPLGRNRRSERWLTRGLAAATVWATPPKRSRWHERNAEMTTWQMIYHWRRTQGRLISYWSRSLRRTISGVELGAIELGVKANAALRGFGA